MSEINAIRFAEPWQVSCVKIPMPEPKPGEALIKIMAAGICGSDIGAFRGTNGLVSYPRVIGHELAGVVVSIPENNKNGIKVGDRVVVDPYLYCGHCYPCSIGRTNCCDNLHVLGVHVEGGMAEYFCHPADMLIKIPDGMSWVQAAMAEPLTISLHGIHRGGLKAGEYCAIIGAGPIGLAAAMVAQAYGAHAILLDLVQERWTLQSLWAWSTPSTPARKMPMPACTRSPAARAHSRSWSAPVQTPPSAARWTS